MATAGDPLSIEWNRKKGVFRYRFKADGSITAPTVIYIPEEQFSPEAKITLTPSATPMRFEYRHEEQRLFVFNDGYSGEAEITVKGKK
jgi:hypothetical protein